MSAPTACIAGAGLVGSLLGTMLAQKGYRVSIFERRPDMRTASISAGRSINLAMSDRGLRALEVAGLADDIKHIAIPMYGRMIHTETGDTVFQPYGKSGQAINSVSRGELNKKLMTLAEQHGVHIMFDHQCTGIDFATARSQYRSVVTGEYMHVGADVVFGADGAFSAVRGQMQLADRFNYSQTYLEHSYKELHIPPSPDGGFQMEKNALHIWPRHSFMLIALPNTDGSFTCTLFLAHQGTPSFAQLRQPDDVVAFFNTYFPDVLPLMPTLTTDFFSNPESSLVTVKCSPWVMNRVALIGDAAHAIVPFYGQGMNCGFEDCRILMDCLEYTSGNLETALPLYEEFRKPDADAIADLAVENFIEMRDKVADKHFLQRKKLEAYLYERFPDRFIPQYTMVTFAPDVPYSEARRVARENDVLLDMLVSHPVLQTDWETNEVQALLQQTVGTRKPIAFKPIGPL